MLPTPHGFSGALAVALKLLFITLGKCVNLSSVKLSFARSPLFTWKVSQADVQKLRPIPILHGWVQFRIFLYMAIGGIACWSLFKFNPQTSSHALSFISGLGLSLLFSITIVYALPVIVFFSPSVARLYPNRLTLCRGGFFLHDCRFGQVARYKISRECDGWVLRLFGLYQNQDQIAIAIPNEEIKTKIENVLSAAGVTNVESLDATSTPNGAVERIQVRVTDFGFGVRKYVRAIVGLYAIFIGANLILGPCVLYLNALHHSPQTRLIFTAWMAIFVVVLIAMVITEGQFKKRLARKIGLICPRCGKLPLGPTSMQALARTQTCAYCGGTFIESSPKTTEKTTN